VLQGFYVSFGLHHIVRKLEQNVWMDIQDMQDIARTSILVKIKHPELRGTPVIMTHLRWRQTLKIIESRVHHGKDLLYWVPSVAKSGDDIILRTSGEVELGAYMAS